jgi:hypothetical protein
MNYLNASVKIQEKQFTKSKVQRNWLLRAFTNNYLITSLGSESLHA